MVLSAGSGTGGAAASLAVRYIGTTGVAADSDLYVALAANPSKRRWQRIPLFLHGRAVKP